MSKQRQNYASSSPWEDLGGYSRAVKIGSFIQVAGPTATDALGQPVGTGEAYEQTRYILQK